MHMETAIGMCADAPSQAATVVQAYPLIGTLMGILLFHEFRGVSRKAQLLLALHVSPIMFQQQTHIYGDLSSTHPYYRCV